MKRTYLFLGAIAILLFGTVFYFLRRNKTEPKVVLPSDESTKNTSNEVVYYIKSPSDEALQRLKSLESNTEVALTASENISKLSLVKISPENASLYHFENIENGEPFATLGLAKNEATAGQSVTVIVGGIVSGFQNLEVGQTYYAQNNGSISTLMPETGIIRSVGIAINQNDLFLDFSQKLVI